MRLDEFVKETILQIAKGVQDAIDEQKGFEVNPEDVQPKPQNVKFCVAVESDAKAEMGIKVVGGSVQSKTVNTIEFEVPIRLPKTPKPGIPKPSLPAGGIWGSKPDIAK